MGKIILKNGNVIEPIETNNTVRSTIRFNQVDLCIANCEYCDGINIRELKNGMFSEKRIGYKVFKCNESNKLLRLVDENTLIELTKEELINIEKKTYFKEGNSLCTGK